MAMASLPAKPSTGGMFDDVSVWVVMNKVGILLYQHSKDMAANHWKEVSQSTPQLVYKCRNYTLYLAKNFLL